LGTWDWGLGIGDWVEKIGVVLGSRLVDEMMG
jgi:hypothetical protein